VSNEWRPTDAQRAAAVERIGENLAVRSGAGCGKTLVLARRFTELLMTCDEAENPLRRFVALSFTDAAALEMLQRVRKLLTDLAAGSKGTDRRRLLGWIEELSEARISTIHSFCASVLRTYAIEAGLDPNFSVCANALLTGQMIAEAATQAILSAVEQQRDDVANLLALVSFSRLAEQIAHLVNTRTAWDPSGYANPDARLSGWKKLLKAEREKAFCEIQGDSKLRGELEALAAVPCERPNDRLAAYRDEQFGLIRPLLNSIEAWRPAAFAALNAKPRNIGSSKAWGGAEQLKWVRRRLKAVVACVADYSIYAEVLSEVDRLSAGALAMLTALADEANDIYTAEKRSGGMLDFTDLLLYTDRLLAGNAAVRRALSGQLDQLLIDECQDTNAFQVAMLGRLVGADRPGEQPQKGKLFLVGDAKQSIYRFRGAQVEVFEDLVRRLGRERCEELDLSFRTHAAGAAFVNHLFGPLMGDDYAPISARRDGPPHPSVEIILARLEPDQPIEGEKDAVRAQAAATAQRISEMINQKERLVRDAGTGRFRPVELRDIAILFTRMTKTLDYERELQERRIDYYVVAGTGFFKQHEVFDILNALRVIDNPFDDVAFFGVLRSGIFGLDDNALMHIAETHRPPYLPKLIETVTHSPKQSADDNHSPRMAIRGLDGLDGLGDSQRRTLIFAVDLLTRLHRQKDAVGIDALLERLLEATGYEAALLSRFQGRRMAGNVRRLIDLARGAAASRMPLADFISQMDRLVLDESRYEQAAVVGEAENVVRLMTVHKAKGLEFPVVFVPDLNATRQGFRGELLNRIDWGLTYALKIEAENQNDKDIEKPLSFRVAKRQEERDQRAEDIRKLYVAATRHKDHLVFVGADWRGENGEFLWGDNYLRRMDGVLNINRALDAGAETIPYAGGKYVAAVRRLVPSKLPGGGRKTRGAGMLQRAKSASELADEIVRAAGPAAGLPLLGPMPANVGRLEIAVTALGDFEYCPMLYRWRYELRTPSPPTTPETADMDIPHGLSSVGFEDNLEHPAFGLTGLPNAAVLGTLLHRCMELIDFAQPAPAATLLRRAAAELELDESAGLAAAADELEVMLERFRSHELWGALAGARNVFRELDFVMDCRKVTLHGQLDLLYEDAGGLWHVVDYKSDRIGDEGCAAHAGRYELQMLLYALAASRHVGNPPADAALYFLRPAAAHVFEVTTAALDAVRSRLAALAAELISARRAGKFDRREKTTCQSCPYKSLCRR